MGFLDRLFGRSGASQKSPIEGVPVQKVPTVRDLCRQYDVTCN